MGRPEQLRVNHTTLTKESDKLSASSAWQVGALVRLRHEHPDTVAGNMTTELGAK